jgi:hypothetical protein
VDVIDLGMGTNNFTGKLAHKMRLVWETEATTGEVDDAGQPIHYTVGQRFTVSLHEKSNLLPFINKWRGKALTAEEVRKFDLEERLIGASCRIMVSQSADLKNPDKVWANVDMALPPKKKVEASGMYTRKKDREGYVPPADSPWTPATPPRDQRQVATQQLQRPAPQASRPAANPAGEHRAYQGGQQTTRQPAGRAPVQAEAFRQPGEEDDDIPF